MEEEDAELFSSGHVISSPLYHRSHWKKLLFRLQGVATASKLRRDQICRLKCSVKISPTDPEQRRKLSSITEKRGCQFWQALLTSLQKAAFPAEQTPQWREREEKADWWWTSWSSWGTQPGSWERPSIWEKEITDCLPFWTELCKNICANILQA